MRIALFVVLLALSALALLFLLPSLKEGHGIEELPIFAAVTAGLVALAVLGFFGLRAKPLLLATGLGCLALPLLAYALLTLDVIADEWRGRALSRSVRILSLRETPIEWPGFDGPVGLRLEIELQHDVRMPGNLYAPKLRMGGPSVPSRREYFFGPAFGGSGNAFLRCRSSSTSAGGRSTRSWKARRRSCPSTSIPGRCSATKPGARCVSASGIRSAGSRAPRAKSWRPAGCSLAGAAPTPT